MLDLVIAKDWQALEDYYAPDYVWNSCRRCRQTNRLPWAIRKR